MQDADTLSPPEIRTARRKPESLTRLKAAARKLTHARILLLADDSLADERSDEQIRAALGTSPRTISRVRQQLVTEGLAVALCRRPQPSQCLRLRPPQTAERPSVGG